MNFKTTCHMRQKLGTRLPCLARNRLKVLNLLVAQTIPSWNQIGAWLQELSVLRQAVGPLPVAAA